MNADTKRSVDAIKANGYWQNGQTLGEGGWSKVYSFAADWKEYRLYNLDEDTEFPICQITAESDEKAIKAFSGLFHLGEFAHEIFQVVTTYTMIVEQL